MIEASAVNTERTHEDEAEELEKVHVFLLEVLHLAVNRDGAAHHVGALEVVQTVRDQAIDRYGPLARTVLDRWGIRSSEDIGRLVFQMIDKGILLRSDQDHPGQFVNLLDFDQAFEIDYPWATHLDEVLL